MFYTSQSIYVDQQTFQVVNMTKFKLSYFDLYGRGELIRLVFAAAKVEFEDHRFSFEEWPKIKPSLYLQYFLYKKIFLTILS